jgi:hypothetical protein
MLPFGSLLSHIPLLILAFAYLVYFGAAAINKSTSVNEPEISLDKVQIVKANEVNTRGRNYYYYGFKVKLSAFKETFKKDVFLNRLILLPNYIPDRKINSSHEGYNLFSRPPPPVA